jgi:ABC-type uncharacterized transport system permease subunit
MRLEKRTQTSRAMLVAGAARRGAVHAAGHALLVAWAGAPVGRAYALLLEGGFGSRFALDRDADPRHAADPHRPGRGGGLPARLYNIGAEGQLYAGALAAVAVGGLHGGSGFEPPWLLFPLMMAAAALAGALLLLGPALLKSRWASTRW